MKILKNISLEITDTNSYHWEFEKFSREDDNILLTVGYKPLSSDFLKPKKYSNFIFACFNNWAPCEYAQNPIIDNLNAIEAYEKFDYVLSICPYTVKWLNANSLNKKFIYSFYPYSKDIRPKNFEKQYDVIYHGGIHGKEHEDALKIMRKYNYRYCSLSYGINKLTKHYLKDATEIDLQFKDKIELVSKCKISICFNHINVSRKHLSNINLYRSKMKLDDDIFSELSLRGLLKYYPWIGHLPQFKTRIHEAAISKTINLVKWDKWNIIEDYYEKDKEFLYFTDKKDLNDKIKYILSNWDSYRIQDVIERAYKKSKRYTTENFLRKYSKIIQSKYPDQMKTFNHSGFW